MEPTGEQNAVSPAPQNDKSAGPAIGIIIIILVVMLGGLYFWSQKTEVKRMNEIENAQIQEESMRAQAELEMLQTQGSGDDLDSIEADLNNTDFSNLGSEIDNIEAESSGEAQLE